MAGITVPPHVEPDKPENLKEYAVAPKDSDGTILAARSVYRTKGAARGVAKRANKRAAISGVTYIVMERDVQFIVSEWHEA